MATSLHPHSIVIACGGTGGHLFPGLAVAEQLVERQCEVTLIVSPKEVDQQAIGNAGSLQVLTLPAVGLRRGNIVAFLRGFRESYVIAKRLFQASAPDAVIAMGGFTSAAPILAGKAVGALTFLHESNTIPGRANRWLSRAVDHAFVGFPSAMARLPHCPVTASGTPVRSQFHLRDASSCRTALGLDPGRPVVLIAGGSQGASGINQMVARSLPLFSKLNPEWQWFHLTGPKDTSLIQAAYDKAGVRAMVHPFFSRMELALGAASAAISRAGASSLAELCAMRVPSLLIPYPAATNNHQSHNASAYASTGAAQILEEKNAAPERVAELLRELVQNQAIRQSMQSALAQWERPLAADQIAGHILGAIDAVERRSTPQPLRSEPVSGTSFEPATRTVGPSMTKPNPARSRQEQSASILIDVPAPTMPLMQTGLDKLELLHGRVSSQTVIRSQEPMARRTTLRVGGPADLYVEPASTEDLAVVVRFCRQQSLPLFVLGRGSNLLVKDAGFRGVVICLSNQHFSRIEIAGEHLSCGAGARLKAVAAEAKRHGLAGLEFLEGIPGTIGGGLRMNAGAMGGEMFQLVESIRIMDLDGCVEERTPAELEIQYRSCPTLKTHLALGAVLRGEPGSRETIQQRMNDFSRKRWSSQPAAPSAGCIFKNPVSIPAGKLVDELGLKGTRVGGAYVSAEHGNFIVNDGTATAQDILNLIELIRERAQSERGIELKTEVEIIGA